MKIETVKLFDIVIPFYRKGRPGDTEHIAWLCKTISQCDCIGPYKEDVIMLALLHDIGYSAIDENDKPFDVHIRKKHSIEGARIAKDILHQLKAPTHLVDKVSNLVLHHDDWALGIKSKDPVLRIFNDFDFMWMFTPQGFTIVRTNFLNKSKKEMMQYLISEISKHQFYNDGLKRYADHLFKKLEDIVCKKKI